jgi:predicted PurR-regulated permease PerM
VAFILLQREDLRNRLVRLAGSGDIQRTTAALDDAGKRLSKLFLTQIIFNAVRHFSLCHSRDGARRVRSSRGEH